MIDIVSTFRSYALSQDGSQRPPDEVIPVRVSLLLEAAAEIERLRAVLEDAYTFLGGVDDASEIRQRIIHVLQPAALSGDKHD
jgi:hypothetical protein